MAVENSKKANLRPFYTQVSLALWLQNVEDNRDSVLVVFSDYALISISSVRLNQPALLLGRLSRFMVF